jgi:RNA polymerase sigma-70 factor, ECF subfamily
MVVMPQGRSREWQLTDATSVIDFYRSNLADVHRHISKLTGGDRSRTEDIVQEAFLSLSAAVRNGRLETATVGWLIVAARNIFLQQIRHDDREQHRLQAFVSDASLLLSPHENVAGSLGVRAALQRLSDIDRAVLVLRYVEDLPERDVAALIDRSPEATQSLLARARRNLRRQLQERDDD